MEQLGLEQPYAESACRNSRVRLGYPTGISDWDIRYRDRGNGSFDIDIFRCGFIAYTEKYSGRNMLPAICQVDYMISHYMNVGFERTGTLGTGCDKCDGKYCLKEQCDRDIEKRLAERK